MKVPPPNNARSGLTLVRAIAVAAVLVAGVGAGILGAVLLVRPAAPAGKEGAAAKQGTEGEESRHTYISYGDAVANLSEGRLTRYVKVNITLQVPKEQAPEVRRLVEGGKKAVFQDWLLTYLSDKRLEEVKGGSALAKLRRDIKDGFNAILSEYGEARVEGVKFMEFNVQ